MEKFTLTAQSREELGRSARATAQARIPAVLYGNDVESQSLWVNATEFRRVFEKAGEAAIIRITVGDAKKAVPVIVRDVQYDPLKHIAQHIDFYQVSMKQEITAEIPLILTGESEAVKVGGTLVHGLESISVRCLPTDLPQNISIDISSLDTFDKSITIADVTVPEGVTIESDESLLVANVMAPRVEEAVEEVVEEATTEGEEEKKDKETPDKK